MRRDLTDITVVMDRSGSMESIKSEAENGLNVFVDEQKALPGEALFTLVQFDNEYEFIHTAIPIKDVPKCKLLPRAATALLDAVGRAINATGSRLSAMAEADRPGLVVFVILTDGHENASREFTRAQIKSMIELQSKTYGWQFTYLGANQDAFAEAGGIGIRAAASLNFVGANAGAAYASASSNVGAMRSAALHAGPVSNKYSDEERAAATKATKP